MRSILTALVVLAAGGVGFFLALLSPVQKDTPRSAAVLILPGETLPEIAGALQAAGIIREAIAFEVLVRFRGQARELKAGPYRLQSDEWAWEVLHRLVEGDFEDTPVTVTEGLWLPEVAERLGPWVAGGAKAFLHAATDPELLRECGLDQSTAEGYLFPDTYRLAPATPAPDLVRAMIRRFNQVWNQDLETRAQERRIAPHDVVTLASIVEAEAQIASERPRIAAVYINRLSQGVALQADPTVHYGLGERLPHTSYADLRHPSPYNTYLRPGLPPGPICSPGLDAMRAVLWPLENCRDLYFVARGDGTHLFATDYEGHQRNRQLVRRPRATGSYASPGSSVKGR